MPKFNVAIFRHNPEASGHCTDALIKALSPEYEINVINETQLTPHNLKKFVCIIFPGGIGEAKAWKRILKPYRFIIQQYLAQGGHYLGICMGAYWADQECFNILDGIKVDQYIKVPSAEIKRSYPTVAEIKWRGEAEYMYFYDGPTFYKYMTNQPIKPFEVIATYQNGMVMALIQGKVGLIGCHPESAQGWYEKPYMSRLWHDGEHHEMLRDFLDRLLVR